MKVAVPIDWRCSTSVYLRFLVVDPGSWPPKSPREALLASPGGRKRYLELRRERESNDQTSPLKRSRTTPNLFSRKIAQHEIRDEGVVVGDDDMDEDEETLRLQLAAIEAKLKLKKLQSARLNATSPRKDDTSLQGSFTSSSSSGQPASRMRAMRERLAAGDQADDVQIPLSPSKRMTPQDPVSPRRALINFKKASEVSLKRPSSARPGTAQSRASSTRPGTSSRSVNNRDSPPDIWSAAADDFKKPKSFSERIAESRNADRAKQQRTEQIQLNRNSAFQIDNKEIEKYKEEAASRPRAASPDKRPAETFSREEVLQSYGNPHMRMKKSMTAPSLLASASITARHSNSPASGTAGQKTSKEPDTSKLEPLSGLNLSNRILPQSFLSRTLENKTVLRIPQLLKLVKAPGFELPESIDGDYVVFGIVASKSDPKQHKEPKNSTKEKDMYDDGLNNTEKYMVITLTDLNWTIDLFFFDTAFPRYYRLSEGTLIAILNPAILPPPPGKIDTNRFSLCLSSSDDTVLEIGSAQDIGYCKAERKDGKICRSWLDSRKSEFCDFHVDVQIRRTQASRAGVNGGTGLFAPGGRNAPRIADCGASKGQRGGRRGLKPEGGRYDWATQSTYFVAPAPKSTSSQGPSMHPRYGMGRGASAAALIDGIDDNPFTDHVRGNANKEERTRRRLVEQQRERDIAQKLSSRGGTTGAEYLRAGLEQAATSAGTKSAMSSTPGLSAPGSQTPTASIFKFRKADEVNLGPMKKRARAQSDDKVSNSGVTISVKKTRFITAKGIREAGRDSLGASTGSEANRSKVHVVMNNEDDDDDDELEII
ncbi:DNA replication protein, putative [Talaromyces marneffei ATCC 18224]|uniref:DNA replication protein, putative n=2 Tax=Talaromyces marneffei TaxID=37727 RepID=B6Q3V8_TALMQ|nr:DNA replication protein, putative [Talaromyces marneffei ATCC 18224]